MTFYQIHQDSTDPDKPLPGRLLQDARLSTLDARADRLRQCSWITDVRNAPVVCGTYSWAVPDKIERVAIPFIWLRTSADANQITVRVRHTVVSDTISIGLVVLPIDNLKGWPTTFPDNDVENATVSTSATAKVTDLTTTVDLPDLELFVFVTFMSKEASTSVDAITAMAWLTMRAEGTSSIATMRPCLGLATERLPDAGGRDEWPEYGGQSRRQIIMVVAGTDDFYVYPPFRQSSADIAVGLLSGSFKGSTKLLSSAAIYGIEIEETSIVNAGGVGSALNPGQPASAAVIQGAIYGHQEEMFLDHTKVHHIGPGSVDPLSADGNIAGEYLNRVNGFVSEGTTYRALASCYVEESNAFIDSDGTSLELVTFDVVALLCVAGVGTGAPVQGVVTKLTLGAWGSSASVTSPEQTLKPRMMTVNGTHTGAWTDHHPIAYLLRMAYPSQWSATVGSEYTDTNQIAHSLLGFYPVDTWHRGRPKRGDQEGDFVIYRQSITASVAGARRLTLWVKGVLAPSPQAYIHCVSWTVVSRQVGEAADLAAASI